MRESPRSAISSGSPTQKLAEARALLEQLPEHKLDEAITKLLRLLNTRGASDEGRQP